MLFKQRDNNFFPPSAYALALLAVRIPFQLIEAAVYTVIVYFWVGACQIWQLLQPHFVCCVGANCYQQLAL